MRCCQKICLQSYCMIKLECQNKINCIKQVQKDHLIEFASFNYLSTKQYPSYRERTFFSFVCLLILNGFFFQIQICIWCDYFFPMNIMVQKGHGNYKCAVLPKDDDPPPPPSRLHSCQRTCLSIVVKYIQFFHFYRKTN